MLLPVLFHFLLGGEDTDIVSKPSRRIGVIPFNRGLCNLVTTDNTLGKIGGTICFVRPDTGIRNELVTPFDYMERSRTVNPAAFFTNQPPTVKKIRSIPVSHLRHHKPQPRVR